MSACYYSSTNGFNLFSEEWYFSASAVTCQVLETLDLTDNYNRQYEHTWPGLDASITDHFSAMITSYLNIGAAGSYDFTLTADDAASLTFDDATTPLINIEGQAQQTCSVTQSVTLASGRHLMRIRYANNGGAAQLKLEYESSAVGLPKTVIDKTVTFVGGRAPSFLEASDIMGVIDSTVTTQRPRVTGGYVTAFSVTPSLPAGLAFNSATGVITGMATATASSDYTLSATGPMGESRATFHLMIGGAASSGISAKYYRLQNAQNLCQLQSFPASMLTLLVDTVDDSISHPELPTASSWNRIPGDVFGRFYVQWKGFVRIDAAGDYEFQLSNRDGARLTVNNEVLINNWGCFNEMTAATGAASFDRAGLVAVEVEFFSNNNDFGIILSWKKPSDDEFVTIPVGKFFRIPEATFTYTTTKTHYYRYVQIIGNTPILFGVSTTTPAFSITPDLPAGLMMQSSGMISGAPSEDSEETTYTITATLASGTVYTTTISMEVTYVAPPTDLTIKNQAGEDVTSVTMEQFKNISPIQLSAQNNPTNWRVEPDLPNGLSIGWRNRQIQGAPTVTHGQTAYTVYASNSGGSVSKVLFITITGCQYGKWLYSVTDRNTQGAFTLKDAQTNATVYSNENVPQGSYGVSLCVPGGDYNYEFRCTADRRVRCSFRLMREDEITFLALSVRGGQQASGSLATVIREKPTLTAPETNIVVAMREQFAVAFTATGMYKPIFATPALPSTVTIDTASGQIRGSFSEKKNYVFTLTAENEMGQSSVVLTFSVGTCPDNKNLIMLTRTYATNEESMVISDAAGEEVLNVNFSNDAFSRSLCLANGDYSVLMKTRSRQGSWYEGSELLVKDSWDDLLASTMLDNGEGEKTEYFTINYAIMDRLDMKFYNQAKAPASKWNQLGFNDNSWATANHDTFGNYAATTAYFRKEFEVDNKNKYLIFAFDLEILDGVVVYINGQEVVRRNLPAAGVTHQTAATERYDTLIWRRTSVPTSALQNGRNVIAVELHHFPDAEDAAIAFDVYGSLLSGECMKRTDRGRASDSAHASNPRYLPANAFDDNRQTQWRDSNLPVFLQFTYNYDRFEYINKITLRAGDNYMRGYPKKFEVLGMTSEDTGDVLASVDDRNLFTQQFATATVFLQNSKSYNAYRIRVEETNDNSNTASLVGMALFTCNFVYCPKQKGWDSVMTGETVYGACPRNTFGDAMRLCKQNKYDPEWSAVDYSNCLSTRPTSNVAYIDFKYMVSNCTMANFQYFVQSRFIDITRDILLAKKENIKLYLMRDCSDSETVNVCFNVRVTTDLDIANYVFRNMGQLQEEMTYRMYTDPPRQFPSGLYFVMVTNPLLRTPTSKLAVVVVVLLVLVIVVGTGFIVYNIRQDKHSKKVRGGVNRKTTLESMQDRMERTRKEKKTLLGGDE